METKTKVLSGGGITVASAIAMWGAFVGIQDRLDAKYEARIHAAEVHDEQTELIASNRLNMHEFRLSMQIAQLRREIWDLQREIQRRGGPQRAGQRLTRMLHDMKMELADLERRRNQAQQELDQRGY